MVKSNFLNFYQHLASNHQDIPFDRLTHAQFTQALTWAIELAEQSINAICVQSVSPSFENTIVPLEQTGREVDVISSLFFNVFLPLLFHTFFTKSIRCLISINTSSCSYFTQLLLE